MHYDLKKHNAELTRTLLKYMNPFCTEKCLVYLNEGLLTCECGDTGIYEWRFFKEKEAANVVISKTHEILFHPIYSSGTAAVRGNVPFQKNMHYYWEVKMISNLYGTDVMVGIGTANIVIEDWRYRFLSLLGCDKYSWGYSYNGTIQHNSLSRDYGSKFGFGSLIGVHLDMYNGTLEYYLNRQPLGIAFTQLKSLELYPMISSTAAQSKMKLTCAVSMQQTLQLICMQCIVKNKELYKQFRSIPGLSRIYEKKFFWLIPKEKSKILSKINTNTLSTVQYPKRRRLRSGRWQADSEIDEDQRIIFMPVNPTPNPSQLLPRRRTNNNNLSDSCQQQPSSSSNL